MEKKTRRLHSTSEFVFVENVCESRGRVSGVSLAGAIREGGSRKERCAERGGAA